MSSISAMRNKMLSSSRLQSSAGRLNRNNGQPAAASKAPAADQVSISAEGRRASGGGVETIFSTGGGVPVSREQIEQAMSGETRTYKSPQKEGTTLPFSWDQWDRHFDSMRAKVRAYYAPIARECMRAAPENPITCLTNRYKCRLSSEFRRDLPEQEREAIYSQVTSILLGHDVCLDSYALSEEERLSGDQLTILANRDTRRLMDTAVQETLAQNGVEIPEGTSFRLCAPLGQPISVLGLDDQELARSIENALNKGDNALNLHWHIYECHGEGALEYRDGHLYDLHTDLGYGPGQTDWINDYLTGGEKAGRFQDALAGDAAGRAALRDAHAGEKGLWTMDGEFHPMDTDYSRYQDTLSRGLEGGTALAGGALRLNA